MSAERFFGFCVKECREISVSLFVLFLVRVVLKRGIKYLCGEVMLEKGELA